MRKAPPDRMTPRERLAWRHNLRWIGVLLVIWFVVSFVVSWFARELRFDFFGWPFSFWVAAQGALIIYVVMAALYAWHMNRVDREIDGPDPDANTHPAPPVDPSGHS